MATTSLAQAMEYARRVTGGSLDVCARERAPGTERAYDRRRYFKAF